MRTRTLLGISGSLRADSANTRLLRAAVDLVPPGMELVLFDDLAKLPFFNPDLDHDRPPEPVQRFRQQVGSAAALVISSPEYAHGVPGALKNALDWLVASVEFPEKP